MPELDFKGKEFVRNHHLTVPYRPLVPVPEKGIGEPDLNGNLIIHGDNLEALKALLPLYAGKVDCIFIDPPYNTGNEGWTYNDNVNSPVIKAWFSENPIGIDDGMRHDKWCCMMWPRLKLLRELLADNGSIWITLDDNEVHRARILLDEIFGIDNFVAQIAWRARKSVQNDTDISRNNLNFILCYAKVRRKSDRRLKASNFKKWFTDEGFVVQPKAIDASRYKFVEDDTGRRYKADPFDAPNVRENLTYEIFNPNTGVGYWPPAGRCWRVGPEEFERLSASGLILYGVHGQSGPQLKVYADEKESFGEVESVWWDLPDTATAATEELREILPESTFETPKPVGLVSKILKHALWRKDSVVLDSFAGSGTTAHAVQQLNHADGGMRKFILVELEDYADSVTAERVRRISNGYYFAGKQRESLMERELSWSDVKHFESLLQEIEEIKRLRGGEFDKVQVKLEKGVLKLHGVKDIKLHTAGLGGAFTFCTLGSPLELATLLAGDGLPERSILAEYLVYLAGLDVHKLVQHEVVSEVSEYYVGSIDSLHLWLMYRPDRKYLSSADSALTLEVAKAIHRSKLGGIHRVYSPAKYVGTKTLREEGVEIEHVPLPLAIFRGNAG